MFFIRKDLRIGDAGGVVDGHMDILPSRSWHMILRVAGDPMARAYDAAELLDVDVKEFSEVLSLIAHHGRGGIQRGETVKSMPPQNPRDSRLGESTLTGYLEAGHPQSSQREHDSLLRARRTSGCVMGP